jgi:APA family basic amino acid/polyamine antiporter
MRNEKKLELVRGLGPWSSAAIVVGTMIGTGIFLKPAEMAADAGSTLVVFLAWLAGGILSLFGALAFAELGAAIPEAGGEYAYLRRGFGPMGGFLFGWMHSIVGRPASMASIAAGLLRFCGFLVPALTVPIFAVRVPVPFAHQPYAFIFSWAQPFAVVALAGLAFINYLGVRVGGRVQVILTFLKVASVATIILLAFRLARPGGAGFHPPPCSPDSSAHSRRPCGPTTGGKI